MNVQRPPILDPLAGGSPRLDEDELAEIEKWFDETSKPLLVINEDPPLNVITVEMFQAFLLKKLIHRRKMHYPHYGEIMAELERINMATTRVLTKEQFLYVVDRFLKMPDIKHELKLAYKLFDTEKRNFLDIDELYDAVTSYGDKLDPEELTELMRDANYRGDGVVVYEEFVDSMFRVASELYEMEAEYLYEDPDEDPSVPPDLSLREPDPANEIFSKEPPAEAEATEVVQPDLEEKPDGDKPEGEIDGDGDKPIDESMPKGEEMNAEGEPTEDLNGEANKAKEGDVITEQNVEEPAVKEVETVPENEVGAKPGEVTAAAAADA